MSTFPMRFDKWPKNFTLEAKKWVRWLLQESPPHQGVTCIRGEAVLSESHQADRAASPVPPPDTLPPCQKPKLRQRLSRLPGA